MAMNSSCSSGLYAIKYACDLIGSGEAEYAVCGGIQLNLSLDKDIEYQSKSISIASKSSVCRPFDNESDGSVAGEAAVLFLLKKLCDAERDNDNIYAVVKGFAANHNGARSNSLASPSSEGQCDVILKAIGQSGVNAENIGLIETHGTGTKIGDPIEIRGLNDAFGRSVKKKAYCSLGAVKSNFGHAGICAGAVGFLKAVCSLYMKKLYPIANYNTPNVLLELDNSPFYPQKENEIWKSSYPRTAGVSSLGLSGTNVFGVLTEYEGEKGSESGEKCDVLTISAACEQSFHEYKKRLYESISKTNYDVHEFCAAMNIGRQDHEFRASAEVRSREDILDFLSSDVSPVRSEKRKLILAFSGDAVISDKRIKNFCRDSIFEKYYCGLMSGMTTCSEKTKTMAFYYSAAKALNELGINAGVNVGSGSGNSVIKLYNGSIAPDIFEAEVQKRENVPFDAEKFKQVMTEMCRREKYIMADMSCGEIERTFCETERNGSVIADVKDGSSIFAVFAKLYSEGVEVDWKKYYKGSMPKRAVTVTYPFQKKHIWVEKIRTAVSYSKTADSAPNDVDIKQYLKELWCSELGITEIGDNESFFDIGADSLKTMTIANKINEDLGVLVEFDDFYDYETLNDLSAYLKKLTSAKKLPEDKDTVKEEYEQPEENRFYPVSYNQSRMISIFMENKKSVGYNIFYEATVGHNIDMELFENSVRETVEHNRILRTVYASENGRFYQKILSADRFRISYITDAVSKDEAYDNESKKVINIFEELPIRMAVFDDGENYHVYITVHHIAADGTAMQIMMKEIAERYHAHMAGKIYSSVTSKPYVTFATEEQQFLNSDEAGGQLNYWLEQLKGIPYKVDMPYSHERPQTVTYNGRTVSFDMSEDALKAVEKLQKKYNMTPFMILESVFVMELYLYSGTDDICIGVPIQGRRFKDTENTIGFFANTVVMRSRFSENDTISDFMLKNRNMILEAFKNQDIPFEQVVSKLEFTRSPRYLPVFQYFFQCQPYDFNEERSLGSSIFKLEQGNNDGAKFEMTVSAFYDNSFTEGRYSVEYNTDLFDENEINAFIKGIDKIAVQIAENDGQSVDSVQLYEEYESDNDEDDLWS